MKINSCCKATAILLLAAVLAAGCGMPPTRTAPGDGAQAGYLTLTDDAGRSVVLQHKPERIVVLAPSFLDLLYAVGGKAAGRPSSNSKAAALSPQMQDIPEVGLVYNINVEKVVALQPDLVIAMQGMHDKLVPVLESGGQAEGDDFGFLARERLAGRQLWPPPQQGEFYPMLPVKSLLRRHVVAGELRLG